MRAIMEHHSSNAEYPAIEVIVSRGKEDICVKVRAANRFLNFANSWLTVRLVGRPTCKLRTIKFINKLCTAWKLKRMFRQHSYRISVRHSTREIYSLTDRVNYVDYYQKVRINFFFNDLHYVRLLAVNYLINLYKLILLLSNITLFSENAKYNAA